MLALLLPVSGHAGSWLKEELDFGASGYKADTAAYFHTVSTHTIAGLELNVTRNPSLGDADYSVRMPWMFSAGNGLFIARPFYYVPTKLVDTSAAGIYTQRILNLPSDDKDIKLRAAFSVGAASQKTQFVFADGSSAKKDLPEFVYEAQFQEDCFQEFYLGINGTLFQYAGSVGNVTLPQASMDQNQLGTLGMIAAETGLPQWSAGFDFNRAMPDDKESSVHVGYHHTEYVTSFQPAVNLAIIGVHYKYKDNANMDFTYNWLAWGSLETRNYYQITFNFSF